MLKACPYRVLLNLLVGWPTTVASQQIRYCIDGICTGGCGDMSGAHVPEDSRGSGVRPTVPAQSEREGSAMYKGEEECRVAEICTEILRWADSTVRDSLR